MRILGGEMGVRRGIPEGLVWSARIVLLFPCSQGLLQAGQVQVAVIALPELAAGGAVEPFHPAIELWTMGRQDVDTKNQR
jgi:hypothetical protein